MQGASGHEQYARALTQQCLHLAEADMRAFKERSDFDPTAGIGAELLS